MGTKKDLEIGMDELMAVFVWLLGIELIGLAALPISSYLCRWLPDLGYLISKPLGILLLTYITWILVSLHLVRFGPISITLAFMILLISSALVFFTKKPLANLVGQCPHLLKLEFIFLTAFSAMALILSNKPDILAIGSEDFMNYAFLQSILRTTYLPPPDPWLSGETLSYYYFGQLGVAILTIFSIKRRACSLSIPIADFGGSFSHQ